MGAEGIEIHALLSEMSKVVGKLLHALHLDAWIKQGMDAMAVKMVITLDGEERREPLYEAHFVPCAPGEHELTIAWEELGSVLGSGVRKLSGRTLKVNVAPGTVTIVEYMPGDQIGNMFAHAEIAGSRPA